MSSICKDGETNITLVKTQTPAGQVVHEYILVPGEGVSIPPVIEAFPVSQIVYSNRKYICTKFRLSSYEVREQESFRSMAEALVAGRTHACHCFRHLVYGSVEARMVGELPASLVTPSSAGTSSRKH